MSYDLWTQYTISRLINFRRQDTTLVVPDPLSHEPLIIFIEM